MSIHSSAKPKQLNNLFDKFKLFLADVAVFSHRQQEKAIRYPMMTYGCNNAQLCWNHEAIANAVAALRTIYPNLSDHLSKQLLQEFMQQIFEEQFVNGNLDNGHEIIIDSLLSIIDDSDIKSRLDTFVANAKKNIDEFLVAVPILGIETKYSGIHVRNVTIHSCESPTVVQVLNDLKQQLKVNDNHFVIQQLDLANCYAVISVEGDAYFAREKAEIETEEAIKLLNFCLSSSVHQPNWAKIGIAPVIINQSLSTKFIGYSFARTADRSLEIDSGKHGFIKWCGILIDENPENDITKRILRSVRWYSKAVDTESPEESFVNLTTALESLLVDKSENNDQTTTGSINQKLRERVAFLLDESMQDRISRVSVMGKLYGSRSGIVHSGNTVDRHDLIQMDNITKSTIMAFAEKKFGKWQDFLDWLNEKKFS
ncbi:MAG TPA: HEPN domain-containing protein [Caldilineaceae bacterium]|nr:HEPN domain-containing protein [Caldilineaceae bacterium]